jgi:coenzyme Q-binding protein COQ10
MPAFRTTRIVAHSPEAMFDLVADVERYPEFLPLCERLVVHERIPAGDGNETIVATMTAALGPVRESFTSRLLLDRAHRRIVVEYLDGPFSRLENNWRFEPHARGCEVDFHIDYEFRSFALQLLMGAMFDRAFHKFAEAFETRADQVYGEPRAKATAAAQPARTTASRKGRHRPDPAET